MIPWMLLPAHARRNLLRTMLTIRLVEEQLVRSYAAGLVLGGRALETAVVRRNVVVMLMSVELMVNAVNLNLVAFSRFSAGRSWRASRS